MTRHFYVVALGANVRHPKHGAPANIVRAASAQMAQEGLNIIALSPVIRSAPVGPSSREYANAAALVVSDAPPQILLARLQAIERSFGRRARRGQRWSARVLDLDIILWSGGILASPTLQIPHPQFRGRSFVLGPAAAIAGTWRDPVTNLSLRQLEARLTRPRPMPR